ncbi:MAG TPA: hypothetical protein VGO55_05745 [Allosphingosinicella sp.]|nr:hypothetical protein [Allosphingosinicella sp.]
MSAAERTDLLAQIHSAQADLDQLIAQFGSDGGSVLADGQLQRQLLTNLERSLASGANLSSGSIRNEIAAAITVATNLGEQARQSISQRGNLDLATAQARTRATVMEIGRDFYERRIFDPYLRFTSTEDEEAYRRREEENRRAIADALAENTPAGDLRAARIMDRQLQDAGVHGADASPQFRALVDRNGQNMGRLEAAIGDRQPVRESERSGPHPKNAEQPSPATPEQLASVLATFRAAGIGGGLAAHDSGHGLTVEVVSPDQGRTIRT